MSRGCLKTPDLRHCELRGVARNEAKQEAIQNIEFRWIASGYRLRNDANIAFLDNICKLKIKN